MKSLEVFYADGTPMNRWLNTIGEVKSLTNKILLPQYLVELSLAHCNLSDDDFRPLDLSNLSSLKRLNLCNNQICMLPDFIRSLNGLDLLSFMGCAKLQSVERLPIVKGNLDLEWCNSLEKITFQSASCKPQSINFSPLNLVEFEYWFKIYPIGSIDEEMINILGLGNYLESVQDININITSGGIWQKCNGLPIQGIQEHGIFNIFLPGNEIPSGFSRKSRDSLISFILPRLPIKKIQGLNIAAVYAVEKYLGFVQLGRLRIQVHNNSKGLKWIYWPTFFGYMDDGKDTIWLSHWKFGNQLEGGDEVSVSIFVYSDEIETINFKEWGIHVVYEEQQEEKMSNQHNTTDPSNVGGIICEDWRDLYEVMPGTYFLKGNPFSKVPRYQSWRLWEEFNKRSEDVLKRSMDLLEKGVSEAECERYKQMMKMLLNHSQKMLLYHDNFEEDKKVLATLLLLGESLVVIPEEPELNPNNYDEAFGNID
ncbi:Leucine-rich repeat [Macleaya cordata]|uniref:Leucine-rich repeat n=1 Tax=Macleaya cordata TaxID=56857 RepID=A0A200QJR5_MACCD|nr:Leucine-rich repeat [Macleaya cordata]